MIYPATKTTTQKMSDPEYTPPPGEPTPEPIEEPPGQPGRDEREPTPIEEPGKPKPRRKVLRIQS